MKTLEKIFIILLVAALVVVALYAYPDTRPMMQDFFANSLVAAGNGMNAIITNPIWLTYIAPYWGYLVFPLGCVTGALLVKFVWFDWYVKGGATKSRELLGYQTQPSIAVGPQPIPMPQQPQPIPEEQKK